MTTLVIHPKDRSTEFLTRAYENLDNTTVVAGGVSKDTLREMISDHNQVVMLGHGSAHGLFSVGQFPNTYGTIIDHSFADTLTQKDNSIFIWCHADQFVKRYKLKGFSTGMFISEPSEAWWMRVNASSQQIADSNDFFARIIGETGGANPIELHRKIDCLYGAMARYNPIAKYNHERLYVMK